MIYLDNSATTKPHPEALESFNQVAAAYFANPSSIHQFGGQAERLLAAAREQAAGLLGVLPQEVIFTSGGTEGNNLAIKGIALQHQSRGRHIITTAVEHPSVLEACESLEQLGFEITVLPVDQFGLISLEALEQAIRPDTILISILHVNNEIGTVQDINAIAELAKCHPKLFLHIDYVQGLGKVRLVLKDSGIDLCTMSGHKIHGLKGTGLLYVRSGVKLFSLLHGGQQEFGIRSGTENLAGAVSFVKALRLIKERERAEAGRLNKLKEDLIARLAVMEGVQINTPEQSAPHIVNFSVPGIKPEVLIHMLGEQGIYISTKSACSSKEQSESRVLAACGHDPARASSGLRVSFSYDTTASELDQFIACVSEAIEQLLNIMR